MKRRGVLISLAGDDAIGIETFTGCLESDMGYARYSWRDVPRELCLSLSPDVCLEDGITLANAVSSLGWEKTEEYTTARNRVDHILSAMENHVGVGSHTESLAKKIAKDIRSGRGVVVTDTSLACEVRRSKELDGNLIVITKDSLNCDKRVPVAPHAFAIIESSGSQEAMARQAQTMHKTLDAEANRDDGVDINPQVYVARMQQTVDRSIAMAVKAIIGIAAPERADIDEYVKRHRVEAVQRIDGSVAVEIDGDLAGEVYYEDGLLTIDTLLAR